MLRTQFDEFDKIAILEPDGALSKEDFEVASESIDPFIIRYGKLQGIIIYTQGFPGWKSFSALIEHLKFINDFHQKVAHIAFVTNSMIGDISEHVGSHFVNAKIKHFTFDKLEEAKAWILTEEDVFQRHGISLGIEKIKDDFIFVFKAIGILSHEDYEMITPFIHSALEGVKPLSVKALVDMSEFEGWELQAAWDDMKIGLKHDADFSKIAIFGNHDKLLEYGIKITSWFMAGKIEQFEDMNKAVTWLNKK